MTFFRIVIGSKRPWYNPQGENSSKRFYSDIYVDSRSTKHDIMGAVMNAIKVKHDNYPNVIAVQSQVFNYDGKMTLIGHCLPIDFDGVDFASVISVLNYILEEYNLKCRSIIIETEHGYHLYCFKIMKFEQVMKILDDPKISKYSDQVHRNISLKNQSVSMRISPIKYSHYNEQKIVYDQGEDAGESEKDFYDFIRKFIT